MKITIIQIGKTKAGYLQEAETEYLKRLTPSAKIEIRTLSETPLPNGSPEAGRKKVKREEALEILKNIPKQTFLVVLDEGGKQFSSVEFAQIIRKNRDFEGADITFVIGGCYGLDTEVLGKANLKLSFSRFTFTHELIRTLLLEQLYRAFSILTGKTYHY
jgi:23S rRNA (pseudouridine1915-N3)-methyltransferase